MMVIVSFPSNNMIISRPTIPNQMATTPLTRIEVNFVETGCNHMLPPLTNFARNMLAITAPTTLIPTSRAKKVPRFIAPSNGKKKTPSPSDPKTSKTKYPNEKLVN